MVSVENRKRSFEYKVILTPIDIRWLDKGSLLEEVTTPASVCVVKG
jgi:hypothetical protein